MNGSLLKIILFFIPLISHVIFFAMEKPTVFKKRKRDSNENKRDEPTIKKVKTYHQKKLVQALGLPQNNSEQNFFNNNLAIPNEILQKEIIPYLSTNNNLQKTCKHFFTLSTTSPTNEPLVFMPDGIANLYHLSDQSDQYANGYQPDIKEVIFCYSLFQHDTKSINWIMNHLKALKIYGLTIAANNHDRVLANKEQISSFLLTEKNSTTSMELLVKIIEKFFSTDTQPCSSIRDLASASQKTLEAHQCIAPILYTYLNKASELKNFLSQETPLPENAISCLLRTCIKYCSTECFNYLKNTKHGKELYANSYFSYEYLCDTILQNKSFADYLINSSFYNINATTYPNCFPLQPSNQTFLSAILSHKEKLQSAGPDNYNLIIDYLKNKNAKTTDEMKPMPTRTEIIRYHPPFILLLRNTIERLITNYFSI